MVDGANPRPSENAALAVPVWDYPGLSRAVASDLTAVFAGSPRPALRNEPVLVNRHTAHRAEPGVGADLGLVVRLGLVLAAGAVGLTAGWLMTHPPAQARPAVAPAPPLSGGLAIQVEGSPSR
jgi:hypothetical protein